MTACQIQRNQAQERVRNISKNQWKAETPQQIASPVANQDGAVVDLEQLALDQITKLVGARRVGCSLV